MKDESDNLRIHPSSFIPHPFERGPVPVPGFASVRSSPLPVGPTGLPVFPLFLRLARPIWISTMPTPSPDTAIRGERSTEYEVPSAADASARLTPARPLANITAGGNALVFSGILP